MFRNEKWTLNENISDISNLSQSSIKRFNRIIFVELLYREIFEFFYWLFYIKLVFFTFLKFLF